MAQGPLFKLTTSRKTPDWLAFKAEKLRSRLRGQSVQFSFDKGKRLYRVRHGEAVRYGKDRPRSIFLYRDGFKGRGAFIFNSYCLQNISFAPDDVVVDCGANSGDLGLEICERINPANYIAIEPNPDDLEILKLNLPPEAKLVPKALGKEAGRFDFYVSTSEADSSLVRPKEFDEVIKVDVVRLDSLLEELDIARVKLLKLEAEGFEPEILEGLGERLSSIEYIAADGGYERGEAQEETFTTITNYLLAHGFEMVDIYFPWHRALYRNTRFPT